MSEDDRWVGPEEWEVVVDNVPLVSVDLIVRQEGGVVLGRRQNEPAKGEWFVPGGVVLKNERLTEAVQRVARDELGTEVEITEQLGTFEHFYDTSDVADVETKHYVANGFLVEPRESVAPADDQHTEFRVFRPPFGDLHPYVDRYLEQTNFNSE